MQHPYNGQPLYQGGYQQTGQSIPNNAGGITTTQQGYTPLTGLIGSEQAQSQALGAILGGAGGGGGGGGNNIRYSDPTINRTGEYQDIQDSLGNYVSAGEGALGLQGALSGAQGQEAFDAAYLDSPVQAFLRDQGDRALTRNAAATGGTQGGNVQRELVRYGQGMAGSQLQQQIDNLAGMSGQGLSAGIAQGSNLGNMEQIEASLYGTNIGSQTNMATTNANNAARSRDSLNNIIYGTGQSIAQGRMNAGAGMGSNIYGTTSALADLQNNQGSGLSNIVGTAGNNQAGLYTQLGNNNAQSQEQLGVNLGNWQTGSAGQVAGLTGVGQFQGNAMDAYGNFLSGAGNAYNAYQNRPQAAPQTVQAAPAYDTGGWDGSYGGT
tara:strand:+ start:13407 stop:14543 length:1137 start_codon:yes stop_codon:yes gene_type:complete